VRISQSKNPSGAKIMDIEGLGFIIGLIGAIWMKARCA
jgi:hypothetical protein